MILTKYQMTLIEVIQDNLTRGTGALHNCDYPMEDEGEIEMELRMTWARTLGHTLNVPWNYFTDEIFYDVFENPFECTNNDAIDIYVITRMKCDS